MQKYLCLVLIVCANFSFAEQREVGTESLIDLPDQIESMLANVIEQDRVDIQPGTQRSENVMLAKEVVFHPKGTLEIGSGDSPYVVIKTEDLVLQNSRTDNQIKLRQPGMVHGQDGTQGAQGEHGKSPGAAGEPGESGSNATNGESVEMPTLVLWITGEVKFLNLETGVPPIAIYAEGVDGGNGGIGGTGGRGGDGVSGRDGRSIYERDAGGPWQFGQWFCVLEPQNGGDSGRGGDAGQSGDGSVGGDGSDIFLVGPDSVLTALQLAVIYNEGGEPGLGGVAGTPGLSGTKGLPGYRAPNCNSAKSGVDPGPGSILGSGSDGAINGRWGKITLFKLP